MQKTPVWKEKRNTKSRMSLQESQSTRSQQPTVLHDVKTGENKRDYIYALKTLAAFSFFPALVSLSANCFSLVLSCLCYETN